MKRVSNSKARDFVNRAEEFQGSNTFGKDYDDIYVVYSYGHHFPMYIYDKGQDRWIGNTDKYSQSTTRHQSLLHPSDNVEKWYGTESMKGIVACGSLLNYMINKAQH